VSLPAYPPTTEAAPAKLLEYAIHAMRAGKKCFQKRGSIFVVCFFLFSPLFPTFPHCRFIIDQKRDDFKDSKLFLALQFDCKQNICLF
jgi:hypothetical protein